VLIVGENEPRKRWELAVEVAAFLGEPLIWIGHRNDLDWKMAYERAVMDRARHLAVRVHRLPDAGDDQLVASYRTARVLVAPSLWEGFNLPIVEALQHGLPAVAIAPRRGYVEDVFGDHVPVADDALDVPDLARFDEEMGLTDPARYREQYVRVYEEAGIE
jgi:glycosyltransferase involved in cell wall biosynthesis